MRIKKDDKREVIQYFRNHNALNKINVCQSVQPQKVLLGAWLSLRSQTVCIKRGQKKLKQYMKRGHINDPIDREYNIWLYKAILHKLELLVLSTVPLLICLGWLYSSACPGCSQP